LWDDCRKKSVRMKAGRGRAVRGFVEDSTVGAEDRSTLTPGACVPEVRRFTNGWRSRISG